MFNFHDKSELSNQPKENLVDHEIQAKSHKIQQNDLKSNGFLPRRHHNDQGDLLCYQLYYNSIKRCFAPKENDR